MTLDEMLAQAEERLSALKAEHQSATDELHAMRAAVEAGDATVTADAIKNTAARRAAVEIDMPSAEADVERIRAEIVAEAEATRAAEEQHVSAEKPHYDEVARVASEERTYAPHKDAAFDTRSGQFFSKPGAEFEADVARAALGDYEAQQRLAKHQAEERVERAQYLTRDVGTAAFAGLVVPQYLTDLYAPAAAARRPFADAIRKHQLPASGMSVNLSRVTTATATAIQSSENSAVQETDIDDTLLTINVQTNAGQQDISRQAIERGSGIEAVVLDDLFRQYATTLDSTLINQATNGLVNVASTVTYTDASPTAAELYPKVLEALSGVEGALLDQASGDNIAVMHSRRWYWMQSQVGTSWPFMSQPGLPSQQGGANLGVSYGAGARGVLPNGTAVIVDNNIPTNLGAGTNEDRIFVVDRNECHLWEDSSAPMFIRAEQTGVGSLTVKFVVYGYFAYTHARYAQARQIGGTGLVAPTF